MYYSMRNSHTMSVLVVFTFCERPGDLRAD